MTESAEQQRARLAFEASLRALEQQRQDLAELRSRTGILIAAASLGASFLGTRALSRHADVVPTLVALTALVTTLVLGALVLAPRVEFAFSSPGAVVDAALADADDLAHQHGILSSWLDASWTRNTLPIRRLNAWFQVAAGALVVQILGWTFAIVDSL